MVRSVDPVDPKRARHGLRRGVATRARGIEHAARQEPVGLRARRVAVLAADNDQVGVDGRTFSVPTSSNASQPLMVSTAARRSHGSLRFARSGPVLTARPRSRSAQGVARALPRLSHAPHAHAGRSLARHRRPGARRRLGLRRRSLGPDRPQALHHVARELDQQSMWSSRSRVYPRQAKGRALSGCCSAHSSGTRYGTPRSSQNSTGQPSCSSATLGRQGCGQPCRAGLRRAFHTTTRARRAPLRTQVVRKSSGL